ncbi:unnamed protein product [Rangifer tarandus platyrhynchus]|uniref:Uncharacterized protein n=1 Tax=Rangifer tarandus platyrhynchus TaxID=3082113 RepID=A0AC60A3U8_RANTA
MNMCRIMSQMFTKKEKAMHPSETSSSLVSISSATIKICMLSTQIISHHHLVVKWGPPVLNCGFAPTTPVLEKNSFCQLDFSLTSAPSTTLSAKGMFILIWTQSIC